MKIKYTFLLIIMIAGIIIACGGNKEDAKATSSTADNSNTETSSSNDTSGDNKATSSNRKGRLIYKQYCVICHGADGTLGISDATDLTKSVTTMEERIDQITNGKGLMTPYKDILSAEQIQSVAEYVEELRQ